MPRGKRSTVDGHPERAAIEQGLARAVPLRKLADRYGVGMHSLYRHRLKLRKFSPEIFAALSAKNWKVKPEELEQLRVETTDGWLKQLRAQFDKLLRAQDACLESGNFTVAAQVAAQVHRALELLGKAVGEVASHSLKIEQNLILAPGYWKVRGAIVQALQPYPEARSAVLAALRQCETEDAGGSEGMRMLTALPAPIETEARP